MTGDGTIGDFVVRGSSNRPHKNEGIEHVRETETTGSHIECKKIEGNRRLPRAPIHYDEEREQFGYHHVWK